MSRSVSIAASLVMINTSPALADQVISDDLIVTGNLCAGLSQCIDGLLFGNVDLWIKSGFPLLRFDDTSTNETAIWDLNVDDPAAPADLSFSIEDETSDTYPFVIEQGAPTSAIYVRDNGFVGLGTAMPLEPLHIVTADNGNVIALEALNSLWEIRATNTSFSIRDDMNASSPFIVSAQAPTHSLNITGTGDIGLGTQTPDAPLELSSDESFNFFRISATGAAVNDSVDITFTGGPLGTGQLRYNIVDGDNQEMSLDANGNMVLDGTLTTAGPTCAGGCDRVFDADYAIKSIEDHQAQMWAAGYLPQVGPTAPDQPINVTDKIGRMLNELEHAHIYIGQMHARLEAQEAEKAALQDTVARQEARLSALEALILQ